MTQPQGIAVTYTGRDDPFIDRMYRSGLTFVNGQSRTVPSTLAQRFLRHTDVFCLTEATVATVADKAPESTAQQTTEPPKDDTQQLLDDAQKKDDDQRLKDDARFVLLDQLDQMDKKALIDWADVHYKQKIPGNLGEAKVRERAKGFIDSYGMPS